MKTKIYEPSRGAIPGLWFCDESIFKKDLSLDSNYLYNPNHVPNEH